MKLPSPIRRKRSRIEIIPLIDIMFFLLASFMMVSLQLDQTQNIQVNLPAATEAQHDFKPDMINIAVDKAGAVWLEKNPLSLAGTGPGGQQPLSAGHKPAGVYQRRPRHPARRDGRTCCDAVRNAGVQKVAFMVGRPADPSRPMKIRSPLPRKTHPAGNHPAD